MQLTVDQWNQVGANCSERAMFQGAVANFRKALNLDPERADIRANLVDNLRRLWEFEEAEAELTRTLKHGMFDKAQFIAGCLYFDMGQSEKALEYLTPKICTTPYGRFVRAQALLHAGRYKEGFAWNEARLEMTPWGNPPMLIWKGEPLGDKVVAIHHEQGYGDSLAYARWINVLPAKNVVLGMPSALVQLMAASFDRPVYDTNEPLPKVDYYLPLMSLPNRLSISEMTIQKPYISPQGRFGCPVAPDTRLKVGLVWRSKAGHQNTDPAVGIHGLQKSIPLEQLLPLSSIPGVQLYSLQTGGDEDIKRLGADYLVTDLASKTSTFHDLALFMKEMDVIVSVDTAPLHLAGAMGLNTIGLLSCRGGWPYPGLGARTEWYQSMQLIRQPNPHDWTSVVNGTARILRGILGGLSATSPKTDLPASTASTPTPRQSISAAPV